MDRNEEAKSFEVKVASSMQLDNFQWSNNSKGLDEFEDIGRDRVMSDNIVHFAN